MSLISARMTEILRSTEHGLQGNINDDWLKVRPAQHKLTDPQGADHPHPLVRRLAAGSAQGPGQLEHVLVIWAKPDLEGGLSQGRLGCLAGYVLGGKPSRQAVLPPLPEDADGHAVLGPVQVLTLVQQQDQRV